MKNHKIFDKKYFYSEDKQNLDLEKIDSENSILRRVYKMSDEQKHLNRVEKFIKTHNLKDKYSAKDLYRWHTLLTASCIQGKNNFFRDHGYDLEHSEATLPEFFEAVSKEHGSEVIEYIRERMEEKENKKKVADLNIKTLIEETMNKYKNLNSTKFNKTNK